MEPTAQILETFQILLHQDAPVKTQLDTQQRRGGLSSERSKTPPVRPRRRRRRLISSLQPHTLYHTIDRRSLHFLLLYTLTRFTISNQYYFTVLMLVIAWRKLDYGSIKNVLPPQYVTASFAQNIRFWCYLNFRWCKLLKFQCLSEII